jgi:hypothetical protein
LRPSRRGKLAGKHMFFFLLYSLIEWGLIVKGVARST